jgi:hypothetical protein
VLALPARARVATFAEGCRAAALDFINRVSVHADKQELADWLRGPYRSHVVAIGRTSTRRMEAASVLPGMLEKLLARTRLEVSWACRARSTRRTESASGSTRSRAASYTAARTPSARPAGCPSRSRACA